MTPALQRNDITMKAFSLLVLFTIILSSTAVAQDQASEVQRAVDDWKLLTTAREDAQEAYDAVLAEQTEDKGWFDEALEFIGLKDTPEEAAIAAKEAIIEERTAIIKETYDVRKNELVTINKTMTQTVWENPTPLVEGSNWTEKILSWGEFDYQLVVTPAEMYAVKGRERCWQDDERIVCENPWRCDMRPGLEPGCEARIISRTIGTKWDSFIPDSLATPFITRNELVGDVR
jgi:hypothetical protein